LNLFVGSEEENSTRLTQMEGLLSEVRAFGMGTGEDAEISCSIAFWDVNLREGFGSESVTKVLD
jgi:hypothetical protein